MSGSNIQSGRLVPLRQSEGAALKGFVVTVKAGYCTPMLHVRSVEESMRFYALLGFETVDQMGEPGHLGWARMHCEGGALMFLLAESEFEDADRSVIFAMYTPDLTAFREHLLANSIEAPPIKYPDYMPSVTLELRDPDGYLIGINHWSDIEHKKWESERKSRVAA